MSIEKIKQRIKMIEENDFNITEVTYASNLEPDEIDALKNVASTHKAVKNATTAVSNAEKIASSTLNVGSTQSTQQGSNGKYYELPEEFNKQVYPIFVLIKKYNITDDIESNGKPIFGFSKPVFKGGRNDTLVLQKSQIVQIQFTDNNLGKIKSINVKKYKANPNNVDAFYEDINNNKNTYKFTSVANTEKFIVIKFT